MLSSSPMTNNLIWSDSHCHLDLISIDDEATYLASLFKKGCSAILIPSTEGQPSSKTQSLQATSIQQQINTPVILSSFGYHPWYLETLLHTNSDEILQQLSTEFKQAKTVSAIGETGLDNIKATTHEQRDLQLQSFQAHCLLAAQTKLPLIIHSVKSHDSVIKQLTAYKGTITGVIHGFTGSYEQAKLFTDLGFYIGVGGSITYPRANKTRIAIAKIPLEYLLLETDAPAMPLYQQQGQANQPSHIVRIAKSLAELKQCDSQTILSQCHSNFKKLFQHD